MRKASVLSVVLLLTLVARPAAAGPLNITNITGGWQNAVDGPLTFTNNQPAQLVDQIRWGGTPSQPDGSGYDFTPGADLFGITLGTPFILGSFTHHNESIPLGTWITAVDYALGFQTNGLPPALGTVINFLHNETPNTPPPDCPPGSLGDPVLCADIVTIGALSLNSPIIVGGDAYFFSLLGFSQDGVTFSSEYLSQEGGSNSTRLFAIVTAQPASVPEPASLLLFGTGLAGLATALRRARRRS